MRFASFCLFVEAAMILLIKQIREEVREEIREERKEIREEIVEEIISDE